MTRNERTQEAILWEHCLIYRNCDQKIDEFMATEGADELIVTCGGASGCQLTEVYVRNPEPGEMKCKVIGSVCAAGTGINK